MAAKTLLALFISTALCGVVSAYGGKPVLSYIDQSRRAQERQRAAKDEDETSSFGNPADEMHARNGIRYAEKIHQENIERAHEAMALSFKLRSAYNDSKTLGSADRKLVERLEKIVRRIRNAAGGLGGDEDESSAPPDLSSALTRLTEASEALLTGVEKTPRMVVSAAVIERTNEMLHLTRYLRAATR